MHKQSNTILGVTVLYIQYCEKQTDGRLVAGHSDDIHTTYHLQSSNFDEPQNHTQVLHKVRLLTMRYLVVTVNAIQTWQQRPTEAPYTVILPESIRTVELNLKINQTEWKSKWMDASALYYISIKLVPQFWHCCYQTQSESRLLFRTACCVCLKQEVLPGTWNLCSISQK